MRTLFALTALFVGVASALAGCGDDEAVPAGAAGTGGSAGSAGASGTSGSAGSGGSAGRGGSAGSAGSAGRDGSAGSAGSDAGSDASDAASDGGTRLSVSTGNWVVYPDPYGDGGATNPIASTIMGTVEAFALPNGGTRFALSVSGLPANRAFGSHLHRLACDNNKAGGHYQHNPFPDGGSASDPTYANGTNEVWLDFTTNASGAGTAQATVTWRPRAGEANAVVIHDMRTGDGGLAGAKLACTDIPF